MVDYQQPFSGFSVRDVEEAAAFYTASLGLDASVDENGMGRIELGDGHRVLFYPKGDGHEAASFTVLNRPSPTSRPQCASSQSRASSSGVTTACRKTRMVS
jgi:catechol 2,3-dioxygenase-like lactoylglutathione lyase family enzyme